MLPVSNAEKFVWRVFFSTVFFILMAIVAYALADATFYLLSLLWNQKLGIYQNWTIGEFLKMTKLAVFPSPYKGPGGGPFIGPWWALGWTSSTGGYFLHSLFILGGCAWHRLAGLKVLGILFVVAWGVPMMLNIFVPGRAPGLPFDGWFALCAVLTVLNWLLAYRFFRRSQIV